MATKDIARRDFLRLSAIAGGIGASGLSSLAFATRSAQAAAVSDGWIPTCCNMCGGTTGILARVVNGRVIKIEPNSANPVGVCNISTDFATLKATGARMCPKGNAGIMSLYDPDRVKKPLKRVGARGAGQWQEITYEQAVQRDRGQAGAHQDRLADRTRWSGSPRTTASSRSRRASATSTARPISCSTPTCATSPARWRSRTRWATIGRCRICGTPSTC